MENREINKIKLPDGTILESTIEPKDQAERTQAQMAKDAAICRALSAGEGYEEVMKIHNTPLEDFMKKKEDIKPQE